MPRSVSPATKLFGFRILLFLVFILGLGIAAFPWEKWIAWPDHPYSQDLLRGVLPRFGDALIIAPLLALLIEFAAAYQLLDAFVENVSSHIIGHLLPKELRQHMLDYLKANFVRTRWFVEYKIESWPDEEGFLKVKIMNEYEVENRSYSKRDFPFTYKVDENCHYPGNSSIQHVRAMADDKPIVECEAEELKAMETTTCDKGKVVHENGRIVYSLAVSMVPDATYQYLTESIECLPSCYSAPFISKLLVLKTTVRILYPRDLLSVDLHLSFAEDSVLLRTELIDGAEWIIYSPILPGQCFFAKWKPNGDPTKATATTSPTAKVGAASPAQAPQIPPDGRVAHSSRPLA
jgi:hypothetical protein